MTNRISDFFAAEPVDPIAKLEAELASGFTAEIVDTGFGETEFGETDWAENDWAEVLNFTDGGTIDEPPQTLSFAEWAPRIRAEREARICPCRRLPHRCSVCREKMA